MFAHSRSFWSGRSLPLLSPDGDGGGGAPPAGDPPADSGQGATDPAKGDEALGDAGKAALQKERDAREAAEKEAKRLKKLVDDAEAANRKREADEAAAKGEFEKLANDRQKEIDQLKADLAERDKTALRTKIGAAHKLPEALVDVLRGETEAELTAHAKELAKHVKPPTAADTETGTGRQGTASGITTAPKEGEKVDLSKVPSYSFMPNRGVPIPS